ncbi:MAG TPA: cellulase family glycosylhydrolase [Enhygromyxa sp.]|nr:cellulase family glycosylhydrolase [Enhygromyxa sp.]
MPSTSTTQSNWSTSGAVLEYQGKPVVLRGFSLTTLQYLLRGIGTASFCVYDWNDPSQIITTVDTAQTDAITGFFVGAGSTVMPAVRIAITACYVLDVVTSQWQSNNDKYPNLSAQYNELLSGLIDTFTQKGVVVILDLHWNDDVTEQQPMALKSTPATPTGDALDFWTTLAERYGGNDRVFFELYNEPFGIDYDTWLNGGSGTNGVEYRGMKELYQAVRQATNNPVLIGGTNWAYADYGNQGFTDIYIEGFVRDVTPTNVLATLHPYQGHGQGVEKTPELLAELIEAIQGQAGVPIVLSELGQYCCPDDGACSNYDGTYNGTAMGYVQAVFEVAQSYGVSWTPWAWRPNAGADCTQPDVNDNLALASSTGSGGADFASLFPTYYAKSVTARRG